VTSFPLVGRTNCGWWCPPQLSCAPDPGWIDSLLPIYPSLSQALAAAPVPGRKPATSDHRPAAPREATTVLRADDFIMMPAGVNHVSAAASNDEDCLEFITMDGRFDFEVA
jgi:hypothetical protein